MQNTPIQSRASPVAFEDSETRGEDMSETIEAWVDDLVDLIKEAQASDEFQAWLDVTSRFHEYSYRNTLLIKQQFPGATKVAGYRAWQREFDRQVMEGEQAIWIWAPIITTRCPECENSQSYHDQSDCTYSETPPSEWSEGLVGFKPTAVFDVSQTEGSLLARGKGNDAYHQTAPHGAGRVMGRREAHDVLSLEAFEAAMDGVYSESVVEDVLDEAPMAYKSAEAIVDAIEPTAEVLDWLDVVHNLKALE